MIEKKRKVEAKYEKSCIEVKMKRRSSYKVVKARQNDVNYVAIYYVFFINSCMNSWFSNLKQDTRIEPLSVAKSPSSVHRTQLKAFRAKFIYPPLLKSFFLLGQKFE